MQASVPSRTAEAVAAARAAHQLLDDPRLFDDPLAVRISGVDERVLRANDDPTRKTRRTYFAARSRFAEDALRAALEGGVCQYVILGAGLDTFAYRNSDQALRIFEVDQQSTQDWKRQRLATVSIAIPSNVMFVPADFERASLGHALTAAGFDPAKPSFFSWLGVTVYISRDAVFSTLSYVASVRGEIVFDYGEPPTALKPEQRVAFEAMAKRVQDLGERWITYFAPVALHAELNRVGFDVVEDLASSDIALRYFGRAPTGKTGGGAHLLHARPAN